MKEIATVSFNELESSTDALVIVRAGPGCVAICSSLNEDGDLEVVLGLQACKALMEALSRAMLAAAVEP
jgi:hypothetical protein